ncbi:MAG: nucleotidyl transferase [Firmicutes bacterium HGW-Firmicutes-13]|nr:MAG: nucleotidyl transferase [Firmicutes bacterium HGW-Firmicutes-13]
MKAVILAAGMGVRLHPLTYKIPKGLLEIDGNTLLEYSLNNLSLFGINSVIIVTGYLEEMIREKIGTSFNGMNIDYVTNEIYSKSGSMYSFSRVKDIIDEDVLLLESDLLYDPRAIKMVQDSEFKDLILVADLSGSGDEVFVCADENRKIIALGKNISAEIKNQPIGELVGISKFSMGFLDKLFEKAEEDYKAGQLNFHYEECVFATGELYPVYVQRCDNLAWIEIDKENDLIRAKEEVYPEIKKIGHSSKTDS